MVSDVEISSGGKLVGRVAESVEVVSGSSASLASGSSIDVVSGEDVSVSAGGDLSGQHRWVCIAECVVGVWRGGMGTRAA